MAQDILRGDTVIVVDPKGDVGLFRSLVYIAQKAGRVSDVMALHLGFPEWSVAYNPVGRFEHVSEVAGRLTQPLPDTGDSAAFKAFAWQCVHTITDSLVRLGQTPTYRAIAYYLTHREALLEAVLKTSQPEVEAWLEEYQAEQADRHSKKPTSRKAALRAFIREHKLTSHPDLVDLLPLCEYEATYFDKMSSALKPLLKKLTSGTLGDCLSPAPDHPSTLDWQEVIAQKKIVYVGLNALTDSVVAAAVGNALLADLVSVAGHIYNHHATATTPSLPRICLHVDEFSDIIGDEFIPLLNKSRGAGFQVTAYTQTWSDVEARLRSRAKAEQVAGNFNTWLLLRVKEAKTADKLMAALPLVAYRPPADKAAQRRIPGKDTPVASQPLCKDVPLLRASDVMCLPKGEAFALLSEGTVIKLQLPELIFPKRTRLPDQFLALLQWLQGTKEG